MKLFTVSDLGVATGFARVMGTIIRHLPIEWDINSMAINYFGDPHDLPAKLYPASTGGDLYGVNRITELIKRIQPDAILMLQDSWIIQHYLDKIPEEYLDKVVLYIPVDAGPYLPNWLKNFPKVKQVCAYTEFGKGVLSEANPEIPEIKVIPHGIDTTKFFPIPQDEAREDLGKLDKDWWIVLNVNRNQPRKRLDIAAKGFGIFAAGKDDVRYYHHAGIEDVGWNIKTMAKRCGWPNKLILTMKELSPQTYVTDEVLNKIYNVADVGLNTSEGEGWGLCFAEDTDVLTTTGFKKIQHVNIGDRVYDESGNSTPVIRLFKSTNSGTMLKVKLSGLTSPIEVTRDHPFLTKDGFKKACELTTEDHVLKVEMAQANLYHKIDISHYGDFISDDKNVYFKSRQVGFPLLINEVRHVQRLFNANISRPRLRKLNKYFTINEDFLPILAHFLGNPRFRKSIPNTSELRRAVKNLFNYDKRLKFQYLTLTKEIVQALRTIAYTQSVYTNMNRDLLERLFYTLIDETSYVHPSNSRLILSAKSKTKQRILRIMLLRLGIASSEFAIKDGTIYFSLDKHHLINKPEIVLTGINRLENVDGYYYRVLGVESVETPPYKIVYNLETESHTYNVYGYVVHNCNMEHAMAGKAQIIPASSANLELYDDNRGLFLPISCYNTNTRIHTEGAAVSPMHVAQALTYAYENRDKMQEMGAKAREYFLRDEFKWENIAKTFKDILES